MHAQGQSQASSGESAATQQQHPAMYNHDAQGRLLFQAAQGYHHAPGMNNNRDVNGLPMLEGLSIQNQRPFNKYGSIKGNLPNNLAPNMDLAGIHRPPYNGQYMLLPNGTVLGGLPQFPQAQIPGGDQANSLQYLQSGLYPGFGPGGHMIQGSIPGYGWPYPQNGEVPDLSVPRRNSWSSNEENGPNTPVVDGSGQPGYYPAVAPTDRSPMVAYGFNTPSPSQGPQPYMPYQMMKSPNGYIMQDLDALTQQEPPIPKAVPAMWTNPSDLTLAKCLENREGITNVYIRGFLPETTDEMLHSYASRFGKIDRCKAIVDLENGLCKGFGFVQFFSFDACENCIRGFFHLGYQASFAQKSRNSRLKDLEDKASSNIYCTNVPVDWVEADLRRHFSPYHVVSEKISRDDKTGVSKEVGFARFESREIAEKVLNQFHNVGGADGIKLLLRFADTKAQKQLKHQSNERRAYRAGEYNFSVEMVQGSTPPSLHRLQQTASHLSPASQGSFNSPAGAGQVWTPATSISPSGPMFNKPTGNARLNSWPSRNGLSNLENTPSMRNRTASTTRATLAASLSVVSPKTVPGEIVTKSESTSPQKENIKAGSLSPVASRKEVKISTPKSTA